MFFPISLVILIGLLLLPATLTIRMEQRWEFGPFLLLLLIFAIGLSRLRFSMAGNLVGTAMLICLCANALVIEKRVSQSFPAISYVYAGQFASSVMRNVVVPMASPFGTPVVLVTISGNCIGTLLDGGFFVVHEGQYRRVECVNSTAEAHPKDFPPNTRIYDSITPDSLVDVTDQWRSKR
jgi:hypothetical protein